MAPKNLSITNARSDVRRLTSLAEISACLSTFQTEEAELSGSLTELLSAKEPILSSLDRLQSLIQCIDELHLEASLLSDKVSTTAQTAERIGSRVRSLDEEMRRVREAAERISQVTELKSSLIALQDSMFNRDWESASRHCARAMSLPREVITGEFAEIAVPTADIHLPPAETLQKAREHLLSVFREEFHKASRSRDDATTSRFFKLFPAIGWEQEGLEAYATFVVDLVRIRAPTSAKTSSPLYYITAVTALFENIAMIVDQHHPIVEKYYGSGKMAYVIAKLMEECDRVIKGLIESWEEERSMKRKLQNISVSIFAPSPVSRKTTGQKSNLEEDQVDPREIDQVLSEMSAISGRWALFRKFILDNLNNEQAESNDEEPEFASNITILDQDYLPTAVKPGGIISLESSLSHRQVEDFLTRYYVPLEVWYVRTIIDKAHRLSSPDPSLGATTTTVPDDVFYVLKIVLSRIISTGTIHTVEKTFGLLLDAMDQDYAGVIKKKLDDVYRTASTTPVGRGDKSERDNRFAFIMLLNDLDISSSHMDRMIQDSLSSLSITQYFLSEEQETVKNTVSSFLTLVPRYRSILRAGVEQLFNQLVRPKLRNLITDVFKDVSYALDDDSYAQAEYNDVVRKRFVKSWEGLVDGYKDSFTEGNYRLFFNFALDVLLRPWEKFIMGFKYTELGAIRFDHDLRSIMAYLSSHTALGDGREKFIRLQQVSTLLNLDNDEDVDDFYDGSGIVWKLSATEARAIVNLKV